MAPNKSRSKAGVKKPAARKKPAKKRMSAAALRAAEEAEADPRAHTRARAWARAEEEKKQIAAKKAAEEKKSEEAAKMAAKMARQAKMDEALRKEYKEKRETRYKVEASKRKSRKAQPGKAKALFQARFTPAWPMYGDRTLLGLPGEVRNRIMEYLLPVGITDKHTIVINEKLRVPSDKSYFVQPRWFKEAEARSQGAINHPLLRTCRQIRYEYGALICTTNTFVWYMPYNWDSSLLTYFTQYAASVGVHHYDLDISTDDAIRSNPRFFVADYAHRNNYDRDYYDRDSKGQTYIVLERERQENLLVWAKDVFDGVETRLLLSDFDDKHEQTMVKILENAVEQRDRGKYWSTAKERLTLLLAKLYPSQLN